MVYESDRKGSGGAGVHTIKVFANRITIHDRRPASDRRGARSSLVARAPSSGLLRQGLPRVQPFFHLDEVVVRVVVDVVHQCEYGAHLGMHP